LKIQKRSRSDFRAIDENGRNEKIIFSLAHLAAPHGSPVRRMPTFYGIAFVV
jgi:hypothetical protein